MTPAATEAIPTEQVNVLLAPHDEPTPISGHNHMPTIYIFPVF